MTTMTTLVAAPSQPNASLYVLCESDSEGNFVDFLLGGGSSAKSYIRAYDNPTSARRALQRISYKPEYTDVRRFDLV